MREGHSELPQWKSLGENNQWVTLPQPGAINARYAAAEHSPVPNPEFHELSKTEEESTRREGFTASVTSWAKKDGVSAQEEILFDPCPGAYPNSTGNIGLCINFKL